MKSIKNIFLIIDLFLFSKVEFLKESYPYQKYLELLNNFHAETRSTLNQLIIVLFISLPLFLSLIFLIANMNYKSGVEQKRDILKTAQEIIDIKNGIQSSKSQILSKAILTPESTFEQKIKDIASQSKIKLTNVSVHDIKTTTVNNNYLETSAIIDISSLGLNDLTLFLQSLYLNHKIMIKEIRLKKDPTSQLLSGSLKTLLYNEQIATTM